MNQMPAISWKFYAKKLCPETVSSGRPRAQFLGDLPNRTRKFRPVPGEISTRPDQEIFRFARSDLWIKPFFFNFQVPISFIDFIQDFDNIYSELTNIIERISPTMRANVTSALEKSITLFNDYADTGYGTRVVKMASRNTGRSNSACFFFAFFSFFLFHFYFQIEMTVDLTDWQFLLFFRILRRRVTTNFCFGTYP